MTHDTTPDASAAAIARSLQQWVRVEIAKGHPARLVRDVIEAEADEIRQMKEPCKTCNGEGVVMVRNPWWGGLFVGPYDDCPDCQKQKGQGQ